MMDFGVFTEAQTSSMAQSQLNSAISTRWVKVRKRGGTVRCRLAVRGHDQLLKTPMILLPAILL